MRSSFERVGFCLGKAKICSNTRIFQRFLTKPGRKDTFQNLMACWQLKYKKIIQKTSIKVNVKGEGEKNKNTAESEETAV
jgi:hypothetical protein